MAHEGWRMSDPETFLSRWWRRKQEAAEVRDDAVAPEQPQGEADAPSVEKTGAAEVETALARAAAEDETAPAVIAESTTPVFDVSSLPSLDQITADTDIRPFLAPGVPTELAREALRRAWAADPSVRDFVGLADYAWDYHKAGSMTGFGPLEMTDDLKRMVARIVGGGDDERPRETTAVIIQSEKPAPAEPVPVELVPAKPVRSQESLSADSMLTEIQQALDRDRAAAAETSQNCDESPQLLDPPVAVQNQPEEAEALQPIVRRTHGGALPKC
jgi:Protein of unknown function (DUF3306)